MPSELTRENESGRFSGESVLNILNILKLIFAGAPLSEVLTIIARLIEAKGNGMLCAIWLLEKDGRHFRCVAAPSVPAEYIAGAAALTVGPKCASCGTAVYRREPVYVADIQSDPLWDDYRHLALPNGLRACWSRPVLSSEGKVLGTFAIYYREVRSPAIADLQLIENANHIVGIAIERHINEEERRVSEDALSKAQSDLAHVGRVTSLGALTASIAHEVNQPLSGIITNASTCLRMLAADPPNVGGAIETARRTIRDANRASDVITRLRALFVRKDAALEAVDLNEATREVIALSSSELQRSRVTLRSELADDLPPVAGDRVQLQQVILNLLRNASDAMRSVEDRPRRLVIRTQRDEDDCVRLAVTDAGRGIEPQALGRLFDAFYTTKSDGMGMGLSVCRSIIERHRGRLWAAPNNDGPGATFSFSIPSASERVTGAQHLTRSM
jgi:signal transduction histidine kinase